MSEPPCSCCSTLEERNRRILRIAAMWSVNAAGPRRADHCLGEVWFSAETRIGTEFAKLPKAKGTRGQGRPKLGACSMRSTTRRAVANVPCARGAKGRMDERNKKGRSLYLYLTPARDIGDNSAALRSVGVSPPEQLSPLSLVCARGRDTLRSLDCPAARGSRPLTAPLPHRQRRQSSGELLHGERLRPSPSRQIFDAPPD